MADFIWRGKKDFSYLISANFTDPKTGRCAWTNQSSSQGPLGIKLSLTSTKRISLSKTLLCVVTGCHIEDLRLLVSPCCSTWITDWDSFFISLFKVKILRHLLWYEIRGISPSFKVFAVLRIPSWLRITATFRSVFHDSRSFRETKSPVSSLQWIIHSSTRWRLFSSALSWELRFAP